MSKVLIRVVIGVLVLGVATTGWMAVSRVEAQTSTSGTWTGSISKDGSKLHLNFYRSSSKGQDRQTGQTFEFSDLQGLSREQAANNGPVSFSLVREAGRIDCEGSFQNGKGSGTFRFTGNLGFVSAMKSRGFDFENNRNDDGDEENRLFAATTLNVTTALADDLLSVGLGKLTTGDLFKAAIFKVDSRFIGEMRASGFGNLSMEELVKARIFKIDGQFVSEMRASGFENLGMEELVKARIFKVDPAFVRQVSQMGFQKEPFESLVKMQIFKVTPEFITEVRNEGLTNIEIEELVKLRIFKIDGKFIREARADGTPLEVEQLVERRIGLRRH